MNFCDEKEIDEKEIDKAAEAVIEKIARKLSNDILFGMNRKETNADSIRTMNDEELADWISDQGVDCAYCRISTLCYEECKCGDCKKAWLKWLKQEAET